MTDKPIAYEAYEALAERYAKLVESKPHNAYYEQPAFRALLPPVAGKRVLDAGCGTGLQIKRLRDLGAAEIIGVEVSPKMVELAQRGAADNVILRQHDLRDPLDFIADESLDVVVSSLVISYIEDLERLFAEFARVLRPAGQFVFSTQHPQEDFRIHDGNYFETTAVEYTWRGFGGEPVVVPCYRRPLSAITNALSNNGFVIERLVEPLPIEEFKAADPKHYDELMTQPGFICFRARKD